MARGRKRAAKVSVASVVIERAPVERAQHGALRVDITGRQHAIDGFSILRDKRLLDKNEDRNRILFEAGDRYREIVVKAGLNGLSGVDLNGIGGGGSEPAWGMPASEFAAANRIMLRRAVEAVRGTAGVRGLAAVHAVTVEGRALASLGLTQYRSKEVQAAIGMDLLRHGLVALAVHWGMLRERAA